MKLTSNFQIHPEIDIDTPIAIEYGRENERVITGSPHEYHKMMNDEKTSSPTKLRSRISIELDDKIQNLLKGEKYTDDQWRHLHIFRFPSIAALNYTKKELVLDGIPVIPMQTLVYKSYNEVDGRDKIIMLTPGVLMIRHLWCEGDPPALATVHQMLHESGVKDGPLHGDVEICGRKVMGCMNASLIGNKMATDGIITYDYNDAIFSKLPPEFYSRTYQPGKELGKQGISGLYQEIEGFNINTFLQEVIDRLGYGRKRYPGSDHNAMLIPGKV